MWLLLSERRDLLRKEPLSILQRKEVPHLRYTCKFLCMRKKKKKKTPAAVPLVATFAGRLLI